MSSLADQIGHYVPLVNLLVFLAGFSYIILRSNGWTGPALRAAIDQLFRLLGEHARANKHLELELRRIERDLRLNDGRFESMSDRITAIDEHVSAQLKLLNEAVESLRMKLDDSHLVHCPTPDQCPWRESRGGKENA